MAEVRVTKLWRWPVKGLGGEELNGVRVEAGALFPFDRAFALENGPSEFDPSEPRHVSKRQFICMVKQPESGRLSARYDDATGTLEIATLDGRKAKVDARDTSALETLAEELISVGVRGEMRLRSANNLASGHGFTDVPDRWISIQNQATVDAVSKACGSELDPRRLRANILIEGWDAWAEEEIVGQNLGIGDAVLHVEEVINRCGAIDVNPETSGKDTDLLRTLKGVRGRLSMGLYARVVTAGSVAPGNTVMILG